MPSTPTCPECRRPYGDPLGCDWDYTDFRPVLYGAERNPISSGPTCRDCGTPRGTMHHAGCACTECPSCHNQWHGVDTSCDEDARLRSGGGAA